MSLTHQRYHVKGKAKLHGQNVFNLQLNYAARIDQSFDTCTFIINWNGIQLNEIFPTDYNVNPLNFVVVGQVGENIL
jgi:hypothetical protein